MAESRIADRIIHTFTNPWTRRHAPRPEPSRGEPLGSNANPHSISVTGIDAGGTSHILNAAARQKASPRGHAFGGGTPQLGSPIAGGPQAAPKVELQKKVSGHQGKHRKPGAPDQEMPGKGLETTSSPSRSDQWSWSTERVHQPEVPTTGNLGTNPNHPLTAGVQRTAIGAPASRTGRAGSFQSAAGSYVPPAVNEIPHSGRNPAGGERWQSITGEKMQQPQALPVGSYRSAAGEAPPLGTPAKKATPPQYEKGMRAFSPSRGSQYSKPMWQRPQMPEPEPVQTPVAAPQPTRAKAVKAKSPVAEAPPAPAAKAPQPRPTAKKAPVKRAAPAAKPEAAAPAEQPAAKAAPAKQSAPKAVAPKAAPAAVEAPPRARKQTPAKAAPAPARPANPRGPGRQNNAQIESEAANKVARERIGREKPAAPIATPANAPKLSPARARKAGEDRQVWGNLNAHAAPGGYVRDPERVRRSRIAMGLDPDTDD